MRKVMIRYISSSYNVHSKSFKVYKWSTGCCRVITSLRHRGITLARARWRGRCVGSSCNFGADTLWQGIRSQSMVTALPNNRRCHLKKKKKKYPSLGNTMFWRIFHIFISMVLFGSDIILKAEIRKAELRTGWLCPQKCQESKWVKSSLNWF